MLIAIPSKGRCNRVKSARVLPSATLFVPESEADAYKINNRCEVVAVPESVRGITRTRNYILDWADQAGEPWVVMIDDDVNAQGYCKFYSEAMKHRKLSGEDWRREFLKLFELSEDLGYSIWGVATQAAPRAVYPYKPILFRSYVTASCMGLRIENGIRFDESFPVKEDYELNLRMIRDEGGVLAARYLYWSNSHWKDEGGCKDYRSQEMEADCIARLIKMYPRMIRKVTRGGSEYSIHLDF